MELKLIKYELENSRRSLSANGSYGTMFCSGNKNTYYERTYFATGKQHGYTLRMIEPKDALLRSKCVIGVGCLFTMNSHCACRDHVICRSFFRK